MYPFFFPMFWSIRLSTLVALMHAVDMVRVMPVESVPVTPASLGLLVVIRFAMRTVLVTETVILSRACVLVIRDGEDLDVTLNGNILVCISW